MIAVGAGKGLLWKASFGTLLACVLVLAIGAFVHKPLSQVTANTLKFGVGVMLPAFGVLSACEGLGVAWPAADLTLLPLAAIFLLTGLAGSRVARSKYEGAAS